MRISSRATLAVVALLSGTIAGTVALQAATSGPSRVLASFSSGQDLPDGAGKDELKKLCSGCHDLSFTEMRKTEDEWTQVVNDMRGKGADGSDEDFAKVIAYLTKNMGKK